MPAKESTFKRRAAHERAVDVGLGEELRGVLRLDRAAVEDRDVEKPADERVRLLRLLGGRRLAGADRPDGLVGEDEALGSATAAAIARTWRSSTCSVSPASRSGSVSPTQAIAQRPASSAALARCAAVSSVSAKYWRRSESPPGRRRHRDHVASPAISRR